MHSISCSIFRGDVSSHVIAGRDRPSRWSQTCRWKVEMSCDTKPGKRIAGGRTIQASSRRKIYA